MKNVKYDPAEARKRRLSYPPISCEEDFMRHVRAGQKLRDERLAEKKQAEVAKDDTQKR